MSRIQELLAQQRKGLENAKPVLQPEPEKTTIKVEEKAPVQTAAPIEQPRKQSLFEKLGKKPATAISGNGAAIQGNIQPAVAEQGPVEIKQPIVEEMPKGLTLLQQRAWKQKHAIQKPNAGQLPQPPLQSDKNVAASPTAPEVSASQQADAQKVNDGTANIEELKHNLAYLANNIENKEIVGQVVRTICMQIKNSPEITPHMTNADVNLVVRGARMAYQVAAMAKQNKEDGKKNKGKQASELDNMFKDAGIDFNFKF